MYFPARVCPPTSATRPTVRQRSRRSGKAQTKTGQASCEIAAERVPCFPSRVACAPEAPQKYPIAVGPRFTRQRAFRRVLGSTKTAIGGFHANRTGWQTTLARETHPCPSGRRQVNGCRNLSDWTFSSTPSSTSFSSRLAVLAGDQKNSLSDDRGSDRKRRCGNGCGPAAAVDRPPDSATRAARAWSDSSVRDTLLRQLVLSARLGRAEGADPSVVLRDRHKGLVEHALEHSRLRFPPAASRMAAIFTRNSAYASICRKWGTINSMKVPGGKGSGNLGTNSASVLTHSAKLPPLGLGARRSSPGWSVPMRYCGVVHQ